MSACVVGAQSRSKRVVKNWLALISRDSDSFFANKVESDGEQSCGAAFSLLAPTRRLDASEAADCAEPVITTRALLRSSRAARRMSRRVEHASVLRKHEAKRVVKNWLALICTIPIRSLRTK
ncbi:hypothetical protein V1290_007228 [Bradyrhizobium sp. AZCC 1578]|uniref:hypothetical protein n=1 Tax=Bradyrhizobium sp. AZCC 1578 TaxID=3117027 RepID=UPI002FF0F763